MHIFKLGYLKRDGESIDHQSSKWQWFLFCQK